MSKVLIAGSRSIHDARLLARTIAASRLVPTRIVQGGAPGVDTLAHNWARDQAIVSVTYFAAWKRLNKKAGPIRNALMLEQEQPEQAIVLRYKDAAKSPGSFDMQQKVMRAGVPLFLALLGDDGTLSFEWKEPEEPRLF